MMRCRLILIFLMFAILLSGCLFPRYVYKEPDLMNELKDRVPAEVLSELEIPYRASPEMIEYAQKVTHGFVSNVQKALAIVDGIISRWELDIVYDFNIDLTAEEAFYQHRANCLTFTNLFVSLSRAVGMDTVYVEVTQIEEVFMEGNFIINSGHICAGLHDGAQFFLIDFSPAAEKHYRVYHEITDLEALANHYNNKAYRLKLNDINSFNKAMEFYTIATMIKPDFSKAYNNMGVSSTMMGRNADAEMYYLKAIQHDSTMSEPLCNLGSLYFSQGDYNLSARYLNRAISLKPHNAHYRYALGLTLLNSGEFVDAEKQFKLAIKQDKQHAKSYLGLAMIAMRREQYAEAMMHLTSASGYDPNLRAAKIYLNDLLEQIMIENL